MESPFLDIPVNGKKTNQFNNFSEGLMFESPFVEPSQAESFESGFSSGDFSINEFEDNNSALVQNYFEGEGWTGSELATSVKLNTQYMKDDSLKWGRYLIQIRDLLLKDTSIYFITTDSFTDMNMLAFAVAKYQEKKVKDKKLSIPKNRGVIESGTWSEMQRDYHDLRNLHKINIKEAVIANKREEKDKIIKFLNQLPQPILKANFPLDNINFALAIAKFQNSVNIPKINGKLGADTLSKLISLIPTQISQQTDSIEIEINRRIEKTARALYHAKDHFSEGMRFAFINLDRNIVRTLEIRSANAKSVNSFFQAFELAIAVSALIPEAEALIATAELVKTVVELAENTEQSEDQKLDADAKYTLAKLIERMDALFASNKSEVVLTGEITKKLKYDKSEEKIQKLNEFDKLAANIHLLKPVHFKKIALGCIINYLAHTRVIVTCDNYFDTSLLAHLQTSYALAGISSYYISEWKDRDIKLIGNRASLKIEFTSADATKLNLEGKDLGSNEEKILSAAWADWLNDENNNGFTLKDLLVKKDVFFRVYLARDGESVAHDVFIRTLDITEKIWIPAKRVYRYNDKNPDTIYFVPVWPDLKAFVQTYTRKHLVFSPVTKGISESNKNHLPYLDIIIGIVNAVMARDFGSRLSDRKISYVQGENESINDAEKYDDLLMEFESGISQEHDDHFSHENDLYNEASEFETEFERDDSEFEFDVPTVSTTTPVPSPSSDPSIAVTQFDSYQVKKIDVNVLSPLKNKKAIEWNTTVLKKINVDPQHVLIDLQRYVDLTVIKQTIDIYNQANPSAPIAPGTSPIDAVFAEAVHQFQKKIFFDNSLHNGNAGKNTLHSLGIISFLQKPEVNSYAKGEIQRLKIKLQLNGKECNYTNWYHFTYNPSVFGIPFNRPVHYILIKQLRIAESYLFNLPRFKGDSLVDMGAKMGLSKDTEKHAGGRSGGTGMHTFGLAIDINHNNNPFIGAGWIKVNSERVKMLEVLKKASGLKLFGSKIAQYLNHLGETKGADTNSVYDELKQRNDEFKSYLSTHPAELSYWKKSRTFQHGKAANGFLNLDRDLVYALRQIANLAWGAIDFGAGDGGNGDIMHFDMRSFETGRTINLKKSGTQGGDPLKTHPYLLKGSGAKELNEMEDFFSEEDISNQEEFETEDFQSEDNEYETSEEMLFEGFVPDVPAADIKTRLDEYLNLANVEYTLEDGTKVKARSTFRYGWKGQPLPPEDAKDLIKNTLRKSKAGAKFVSENIWPIHYVAYGRPVPAHIKKVTQALIDAGEFAKLRASDTTSSDQHLIRKLQAKFGVGIDCAGYVQLAYIHAYMGSDADPKETRVKLGLQPGRGDEDLQSLTAKHFKKLGITDARTGDLIILNSRAGDADRAGHTVIVVDHTTSGSVHSFIVDASWGNDMYGFKAGGIARRTLFFDADKKTWWDIHPIDGTDVNKNTIGPYGGHRFQGVYRPIVSAAFDKEILSTKFENDNSEFENAGYTKVGNEFEFEESTEFESGNSEFEFENTDHPKAGNEFEFEEEFESTDAGEFESEFENDKEFETEFEAENINDSGEVILNNEYNVDAKFGVTGYLDVSAVKNSGLRTGVFIPSGFNAADKVDIIVYLHGLYDYGSYKYGMAYYWKNYSNIREHFYSGNRNAILLAPALGSNPQVMDLVFKYKNGFDAYVSNCIKDLITRGKLQTGALPGKIIIAAHSAGGYPMSAILRNQNNLNANIIEAWGFDCFYNYGWETVLEKNSAKPFYHYWAYTNNGKMSGPGWRGSELAKRFSNLKNIQLAQGIHHREVIEHAWKNEINKRNWFAAVGSPNGQTPGEAANITSEFETPYSSYENDNMEAETRTVTSIVPRNARVFMTLSAQKQGKINGGVTQKGREGSIAVYKVHHEVNNLYDSASGLVRGRRVHNPFTITKEVDAASVKMMNALVTNEVFKEVVINFWQPSADGKEINNYRVTLNDAVITNISLDQLNSLHPSQSRYPALEQVQFIYQKITWDVLTKPSSSAVDSWNL